MSKPKPECCSNKCIAGFFISLLLMMSIGNPLLEWILILIEGIHPAPLRLTGLQVLYNNKVSDVDITWQTNKYIRSHILYGDSVNNMVKLFPRSTPPSRMSGDYTFSVPLQDLAVGKRYFYQLHMGSNVTEVYNFQLPAPQKNTSIYIVNDKNVPDTDIIVPKLYDACIYLEHCCTHSIYSPFLPVITAFKETRQGRFGEYRDVKSYSIGLSQIILFSVKDCQLPGYKKWLQTEVVKANKNRDNIPWIVIVLDKPLYNSYVSEVKACDWLEDTLYVNGVDIVLSPGPNIECSKPVYKGKKLQNEYHNPVAPIYITVGYDSSVLGSHKRNNALDFMNSAIFGPNNYKCSFYFESSTKCIISIIPNDKRPSVSDTFSITHDKRSVIVDRHVQINPKLDSLNLAIDEKQTDLVSRLFKYLTQTIWKGYNSGLGIFAMFCVIVIFAVIVFMSLKYCRIHRRFSHYPKD